MPEEAMTTTQGVRPPDGKLTGGEYYDVVVFFYGRCPTWSLELVAPTTVTFRCVGHGTPRSLYWHLNNICPDQPLPPCLLTKGSYMGELLNILAAQLTRWAGKHVSGLYKITIETPTDGPGSFWRNAPDVFAAGNYYAAMETTSIQQRVNGAAHFAGGHLTKGGNV